MKTVRKSNLFLATMIIFGLIIMGLLWWAEDFSWYEKSTYKSMNDLVCLLQEELKTYDLEKYNLHGIMDYTYEYSYEENAVVIKIDGTKLEHVDAKLKGDSKEIIKYKIRKEYGLDFWTTMVAGVVLCGCVPAVIITGIVAVIEVVVKKVKEKTKKN